MSRPRLVTIQECDLVAETRHSDPLSSTGDEKADARISPLSEIARRATQARLYQELVRQELEMEPDSEIEALASV